MVPLPKFSDIVVCDDHYVSALGIEVLLRDHLSNPLRIRTATTGKIALDLVSESPPDLIVVDLGLPDMSGLEVIKQARAKSPASRVIVLTGMSEPHALHQAFKLKVDGILRKMNTAQNLNEALNFIRTNPDKVYLDPLVEGILRVSEEQAVTPREYEVLELMTKGHTTEEIANKMKCAVTTVKTYRTRIMNKSGARNSAEMMAWYLKGNGKKDFGSHV